MRLVELAGTDLTVSRLGFGLSGLHHQLRTRHRQSLLAAALDCGINYFDTAPYYGHGIGERELGRFAKAHRQRIVLATKVGVRAEPWFERVPMLMYARLAANAALSRIGGTPRPMRTYDYGAAYAVRSVDGSLRRLKTDHIDVLYVHEPTLSALEEPEALLDVLEGLRRSGKVRHFGLSGDPRHCRDIAMRYPVLGRLMQVDASDLEALGALRTAGLRFHSTFGNFRGKNAPIDTLLSGALTANPDGIILFSTRLTERIARMTELLEQREA